MEEIIEKKDLKPMNKAMLVTHGLNNVVSVFVSTFLISYIYTISTNYVLNIGLFYCFNYLSMMIFYYLISKMIDRTNRITFYRIAIVIRGIFIIGVVFLGEELANYVIFAGVLHGFSEACYWTSYNLMKNELVSKHIVSKYSVFQQVIEKVINVVVPLVLGKIIDNSKFRTSAIIVFVIVCVELVFSIVIKSKKPENAQFDMRGFSRNVKVDKNKKKLIGWSIFIGGIYGLTSVLSPLCTILIMYSFDSNFSLGIITGLISLLAVGGLIFLKRKTQIGKRSVLFLISAFLPVLTTIVLVFWVSKPMIIIYSIVITVCSILHGYSFDVIRNLILKKLNMYDDIAEYQCSIECLMELERVIIFALMIAAGAIGAVLGGNGVLIALKVFMIIASISMPLMNLSLMKYEKFFNSQGIIED